MDYTYPSIFFAYLFFALVLAAGGLLLREDHAPRLLG